MKLHKKYRYGLESTAAIIAGVSMMVIVFSVGWFALSANDEPAQQEVLGEFSPFERASERISYLEGVQDSSGYVAGITDDLSLDEIDIRNVTSNWLSEVREMQDLPVAYRDSVLDRNAQNQARLMAQTCEFDQYSVWSESINSRIDEGFITSFSESTFELSGPLALQVELPQSQDDYARIFTLYNAYGVGVAAVPQSIDCGVNYVLVFHFAETN